VIAQLSCVAALVAFAGPEVAPSAAPTDPVAEVVVTGERVARPLQKTPSSVVVATAADIEAQASPNRLEQLLALIPNLQLGSGSSGPTIRGQDSTGVLVALPAFLGGARPRLTLQVDGRALGYHEFVFGLASIWDVQQVEVFRSPQTTTQGRNSIAGAIFVRTNDPTYAWEGRARVLGGGLDTWQGSAVVSGPIARDQLAFRFAADVRTSRPASRIADRIVGASPDHDDYGLARLKVLAEPQAVPGARVELTFTHLESQAPQLEGLRPPFKARQDPVDGYGVFRTNVDALTGVLDYQLGRQLVSTTTVSYGDSFIQRFAPPGLGQAQIALTDASLESILKWRPEGPIEAVGGVHGLRTHIDQHIDVSALGVGNGDFADTQHSLGVFGEATWRALPRLAITAGLRYQRDDQRRTGFLGTSGRGVLTDYDETFDAWLPKVSAAYDLAPGVTAGVLVQRAFNPGGMTINLDLATQDTFEAETLWAYEAFLRASMADGRVKLAANAFYYDIKDAQRPQTTAFTRPDGSTGIATTFANAPAAESYGLELQADWRPSQQLAVRAGVGLLKTKILETLDPRNPIRGKSFLRSPALTASASLDWRPIEPLALSAQLKHGSAYYSNDANTPAFRIDGSTVVDARAAYTMGRVTAFASVRNLFDAFNLTWTESPTLATANEPRTLSLGFDTRF